VGGGREGLVIDVETAAAGIVSVLVLCLMLWFLVGFWFELLIQSSRVAAPQPFLCFLSLALASRTHCRFKAWCHLHIVWH
jgi:hypothetical protein